VGQQPPIVFKEWGGRPPRKIVYTPGEAPFFGLCHTTTMSNIQHPIFGSGTIRPKIGEFHWQIRVSYFVDELPHFSNILEA